MRGSRHREGHRQSVIHYVGVGGPGPFPQGWDTDPTNDSAPVVVTSG